MTRFTDKRAAGFTLIELMVVMALIATLAAIVMLVAPSVLDADRARDGATQIQGALQNARLRAMRDGLPRGVRLVVDPTFYTPTPNAPPYIFVTSSAYQYIEVPPVYVPNPNAPGPNPATGLTPYVQFIYTHNPVPPYAITNRTCTIGGLSSDQLSSITNAVNNAPASNPATLALPTLGVWSTMSNFTATSASTGTATLFVYPDSQLGGATLWNTYHFGIYNAPRPLLGEETMQMPLNTCVDLSTGMSFPSFSGTLGVNDYDVLFNPAGQLMTPIGVGQVYLWVRDPTKGKIITPVPVPAQLQISNPGSTSPFWSTSPFQWGGYTSSQFASTLPVSGEQLLVSIRANSGGTGVSPVFWPTVTTPNPYFYALSAANSP